MAIVEYDSGNATLDHILTYVSVLLLVLLSGLFSGLTLGLLGLDLSELEIVKGGGSDVEKRRAGKVMKMRRDGNRLLCTLLLGNVAVNALLSYWLLCVDSTHCGLRGDPAPGHLFEARSEDWGAGFANRELPDGHPGTGGRAFEDRIR